MLQENFMCVGLSEKSANFFKSVRLFAFIRTCPTVGEIPLKFCIGNLFRKNLLLFEIG